jgi:hypothetical protein
MPDESSITRLERVLDATDRHGVKCIVIGGQAEALMGTMRPTLDVDLCYSRETDNLKRVAAMLRELHVTLRGAPPGLPFRIDEITLEMGQNFTFDSDVGELDLLGYVEPIGGYEELCQNAEEYELGPRRIRTISLEDLITVKQHLRRAKDQASLVLLLELKRERDREKRH